MRIIDTIADGDFYIQAMVVDKELRGKGFGNTLASFNALRHKFKTRKLTFLFTEKRGPQGSRVPKEIQQRIFDIRRTHNLSNDRIAEILAIEGHEVSPRTISRLLKAAGFPPVPRRAKLTIVETVKDH